MTDNHFLLASCWKCPQREDSETDTTLLPLLDSSLVLIFTFFRWSMLLLLAACWLLYLHSGSRLPSSLHRSAFTFATNKCSMTVYDPSGIAASIFHGKSSTRATPGSFQPERDISRNRVNKTRQITNESNVNVEHKFVPIATAPQKQVGKGVPFS